MKRVCLGLLLLVGLMALGAGGASAAPAPGALVRAMSSVGSSADPAYYVVRRGYYGPHGGCRRVRVCGPYGCVWERRCW